MPQREDEQFIRALFGTLLSEGATDEQHAQADDPDLDIDPWLTATERLQGGCCWLFDSDHGELISSGLRGAGWHRDLQHWRDIDPLLSPDQPPGPVELNGRVLWAQWVTGPSWQRPDGATAVTELLSLRPPVLLSEDHVGNCQILFSDQKIIISHEAQHILDWDQCSVGFDEFLSQVCHPLDHDRVQDLLQHTPTAAAGGMHFRIVHSDGTTHYVRFAGNLSSTKSCWWGCLHEDSVVLPECYAHQRMLDTHRQQRAIRHHIVIKLHDRIHHMQQQLQQLGSQIDDHSQLDKLLQPMTHLGQELADFGLSDAIDDEPYWQAVDLAEVIRQHVAHCQHIASRRGIELAVIAPERLPEFYGDQRHFSEMVRHLLENAVLFSVYGRIELRYDAGPPRQDGRIPLTIVVRDQGIGMSDAQVQASLDFRGQGVGLGLCRYLAGVYKGQVFIESSISEGCAVTIACFPLPVVNPIDETVRLSIGLFGDQQNEVELLASGLEHWQFITDSQTAIADSIADVLLCLSDDGDFISHWQHQRSQRNDHTPAVILTRLASRPFARTTWLERPFNRHRLADVLHRLYLQSKQPSTSLLRAQVADQEVPGTVHNKVV